MRYYSHSWKRIFLAPDTGGGGSGSQGNPAAAQAGGSELDDSSTKFVDPTVGIDLDDLPPEVREIIEKSRIGFATLQKEKDMAAQLAKHEEQRRKDFQSNYDKLKGDVDRLTGGPKETPKKPQLEKFTQILIQRGVKPEHAGPQAELMLEMMTDYGNTLKGEIGNDLRPFATSVIEREAQFAWNQAVATDTTGALQNPTLAQTVWQQVEEMAKHGQQVTPEIVLNLTGMAHFAALQRGEIPPTSTKPVTTPTVSLPNIGRLTYPGAGSMPSQPQQFDPNGARHALNSDTDAALQVVLGKWATGEGGVKAPGYRAPAKRGSR